MLKKECCKQCHQNMFCYGWTCHDEEVWEGIKLIVCPLIYLGKEDSNIRKIKEQPPKKCPYFLENII